MSALKVTGRVVTGMLINDASDESNKFVCVAGFGDGFDWRFLHGKVDVPGIFDFVANERDLKSPSKFDWRFNPCSSFFIVFQTGLGNKFFFWDNVLLQFSNFGR